MDMDNEYPFILLRELTLENVFVTSKLVQKKRLILCIICRKYKKNK